MSDYRHPMIRPLVLGLPEVQWPSRHPLWPELLGYPVPLLNALLDHSP